MKKDIMTKIARLSQVTELKSESVELASIDMLEAMYSDAVKIFKKGEEYIKEKAALDKKAKILNSESKAMINGASKELKEFNQQAKELGLDGSKISSYKKLRDMIGALDTVEAQTKKV